MLMGWLRGRVGRGREVLVLVLVLAGGGGGGVFLGGFELGG
jgi:hypothetical protein